MKPAQPLRPARQTSPLRRLREIAVGLLSLVVLLAATFGLPVVLYVVTKGLLPHHGPTGDGVKDLFTKKDDGTTFLAAIAVVAWLGWAAFAISVLVEIPARLSGRAAIRLPGLGWSQKAATGLLSGIALLLSAAPGATTAHSAVPHVPAVVATASVSVSPPAATTLSGAAHHVDAGHGSSAHTTAYVVQPGDSLWKIAEDRLGSGDQYPKIAALNTGRVMADGTVFHSDGLLQPGWTLLVPSVPAATPAPAAHSGLHDTPEERHVVKPGESLWAIAGHDYGDATQWPRIFAANEGAEQNGGHFTNPNLIFPGEKLKIPHLAEVPEAPSAPAHAEAPHAEAPQGAPHGAPHGAPQPAAPIVPAQYPAIHAQGPAAAFPQPGVENPAPSSAPAPAPAPASIPATDPASIPTSGSASAPTSALPSIPSILTLAPTASSSEQDSLLIAFGISGVSAAALLLLLAQRRRNQQNRRGVGERIAMPAAPVEGLERRLRAGADPAARDFLDRVLRTLAKHSADTGRPIPEVSAAILRPEGVELRLSHPCPPIAPFAALGDAVWWCAKDQAKLLPRKAAAGQPVPYPALVMMAHTGGGEPVLLDLEHYGVVQIAGDRRQAAAAVRSLGVELPWSDYVSVAPAGLAVDPALARNPVRHDPPEQVLPALEQWAQAVRETLPEGAGAGMHALQTARIAQTGPGTVEPRVLLGTDEWAGQQDVERLRAIAEQQPRAAAAAVVAVDDGVAPVGHRITVDAAGNALLHDLNLSVTLQRVDPEQHGRLLSIMTPTGLPSVVDPEWQFSLDEFQRTAAAQTGLGEAVRAAAAPASARAVVWIRVLGDIQVAGDRPVTDPKLVETAACVALLPGTGAAGLSTALGIGAQAAGTRLAQLRDAFGLDPSGRELLPVAPDGRVAFTELVGCDWAVFEEHRRNGRFAEALALVRGEPFADAWPGRYSWAEPYRQAMVSTVIDVAHTLAGAYLADRDFAAARLAVSQGMLAAPYAELLYRDLMVIVATEARPDHDDELTALFGTFTEVCDEYGVEPMPETVRVMQQLNGLIRVRRPVPGLRTVS